MPVSKKRIIVAAAYGLTSAFAMGTYVAPAMAATSTSTFQVTATVAASCQISTTNLAFGAYTGAATTATSTISVTCTSTTLYNVGLNAGTATGATVTTRQMTGSANANALLNYALYRDSAHTLNWGNTVGTDTMSGSGSGAVQSLTVYGQIPASQIVAPGSYTDTITATITY